MVEGPRRSACRASPGPYASQPEPGFPRQGIPLTFCDLLDQPEISAIPPGHCDWFVDETGRQNDGEVCPAVEAHADFVVGDLHICGHVDEVAEDLARLRIFVSTHATGHQTIET